MLIVLGILSAGLLGLIIYFIVSSKSSRLLRLSALIALGFIALSIGVCGILIIMGPKKEKAEIALPFLQDAAPPAKTGSSFAAILIFLVLFLLIVGITIYLSLGNQKKNLEEAKRNKKAQVFIDDDHLNIGKAGSRENADIIDDSLDDSFDIEIK